ncbi:hypothetical protein ABZ841_34520 [Streptomyces flaveolus]
MNHDAEQHLSAQANPGYAAGQLAAALPTAAVHDHHDTRRRAENAAVRGAPCWRAWRTDC